MAKSNLFYKNARVESFFPTRAYQNLNLLTKSRYSQIVSVVMVGIEALTATEAQKKENIDTRTKQIEHWNDVVKGAEWQSLIDVQTIYRDAEAVGNFTVFNIKGNKYRLIVSIDYQAQLIYYKYFLTHAEYDKENWKNDDYY